MTDSLKTKIRKDVLEFIVETIFNVLLMGLL
jgi:hypothetical protein